MPVARGGGDRGKAKLMAGRGEGSGRWLWWSGGATGGEGSGRWLWWSGGATGGECGQRAAGCG